MITKTPPRLVLGNIGPLSAELMPLSAELMPLSVELMPLDCPILQCVTPPVTRL